jgi:uncharacterized protein YkwD
MIGKVIVVAIIILLVAGFTGINFLSIYKKTVQVRTTAEPVIDGIIEHGLQDMQSVFHPNQVSAISSHTPAGVISSFLAPKYSGTQLQNYALQLINQDRKQNGLGPVVLSPNQAAQAQAENVLGTRQISHWMTDGEKPYMTYTKYGGLGAVEQNVATALCQGFACTMNPIDQIKTAEYEMMYNDASSNWGHKDNILDPHHTSVSLGIAYNDNTFVIVQNFENNYIDFTQPITYNSGVVSFSGILSEGKIDNIEIDYDSLPTTATYQQNKMATSYTTGTPLAIVDKPLPWGQYYQNTSGYPVIIANTWSDQGKSVVVSFDASQIITKPGVYDVLVWLDVNGQTFPATYYSIVKQ